MGGWVDGQISSTAEGCNPFLADIVFSLWNVYMYIYIPLWNVYIDMQVLGGILTLGHFEEKNKKIQNDRQNQSICHSFTTRQDRNTSKSRLCIFKHEEFDSTIIDVQ